MVTQTTRVIEQKKRAVKVIDLVGGGAIVQKTEDGITTTTFEGIGGGSGSGFTRRFKTTPKTIQQILAGASPAFRQSFMREQAQRERNIAEAQRRNQQKRERELQRIRIQTQKKIADIQKDIQRLQRGKTTNQKIQLQKLQRQRIENVLKSQTQRKVDLGLIKAGSFSTSRGVVRITKEPQLKITTTQIPQTKVALKTSKSISSITPRTGKIVITGGGIKVFNDPITTSFLVKDGKLVFSENKYIQIDSKFFKGRLPRGNTPKQVKRIKKIILDLQKKEKKSILSNKEITKIRKNINKGKDVAKLLLRASKLIPSVFVDYGKSLGKGVVKVGLYATDNTGEVLKMRYNIKKRRLELPRNIVLISDKPRFGKIKKWANYDYMTNPLYDPDYQNVAITTAFVAVGVASPATATKLFGVLKGKAVYDAVKDPSEQNIAIAMSLFLPGAVKKTFKGASKLSPKFKTLKGGKIVLRKAPVSTFAVKGKPRFLKTRVQKPSFKRPFSSVANFLKGRKPGQFKKFTKDPGLVLKEQTVKTGGRTLSKQVELEGKEVTAVNAAADQLTSWLRRKKIIRKPIPGEADFPTNIKNILQKFDAGKKLTTKEFASVNLWLQKNVAPNITLLERSLYLDPEGGLRISRLGIQKESVATFKDVLRGNFQLRGARPQVLIFENAKIAKFPKSLSNVKAKLKANKPLTTAETNQLIRWQVKTGGGKFKPIGSTIYEGGKELEVTLAPREFIKRIKNVGFTFIEGKKVTFVTSEIYKPPKVIANKIKLANNGKLSPKALKNFENQLSKILGRKIRIETPKTKGKILRKADRRVSDNRPVLRINKRGIAVSISRGRKIARTLTKRRPTVRKTPNGRKPTRRTPTKRTPTRRKPGKRKPTKRRTPTQRKLDKRKQIRRKAQQRPRLGRPGRPKPKRKSPRVPIIIRKKFKKKILSKKVPVFFVKIKRHGRIINLTPRPLILRDAKDFLAYRLDQGLSRSAWFEPIGKAKNVVVPPKAIKGYFNKVKRKLRPFKIRVGKRKDIRNGYIEKKKFIGDTKSEIRQLQASRRKRSKNPIKKRTIRRKRNPTLAQRKRKLIQQNARLKKSIRTQSKKRRPVKTRKAKRKPIRRRKQKRKIIKRKKGK